MAKITIEYCSNYDSYNGEKVTEGKVLAPVLMTSDAAMTSIAIEQIMSELSEAKGQLPIILKLRAQGLTPKEIGYVLGMKKTKLYKSLKAIGRIADKYI